MPWLCECFHDYYNGLIATLPKITPRLIMLWEFPIVIMGYGEVRPDAG